MRFWQRAGVLHEEIAFSSSNGPERTGLVWLRAFAVSPCEPRLVAGALVDITERKQLEEKLRRALRAADKASQAKSDFLTHMSHELGTPMNGILGLCELLLHDELSLRQRDFLEKIHFSTRLLVRLIGDILDFSKMETGALRALPRPRLIWTRFWIRCAPPWPRNAGPKILTSRSTWSRKRPCDSRATARGWLRSWAQPGRQCR